jgi:hypothetical protein
MVKLIIQKKKTVIAITKSYVCPVKILDLLIWCPILVLSLDILGFVGKGAAPLVGQPWGWRQLEGFFFFFFCFPWSYGPSVASGYPELISPGDWLVNSIWFLLSTGHVYALWQGG